MIQKLIDADSFKKSVLTDFLEHYTQCHDTDQTSLMDMIMDNLDEQPTVDAVEVVRCRECKHFRHYGKTSLFINGKNIKAGWCQRRISYDEEYRMTADDFCSYGERKGGDGNG